MLKRRVFTQPGKALILRNLTITGMAMRYRNRLFVPFSLLSLAGCGLVQGAPSFSLFGAFFPGWMFCATLGVLVAVGARAFFVVTGWAEFLPYQLFVCASLGLMSGLFAWLFWFGS